MVLRRAQDRWLGTYGTFGDWEKNQMKSIFVGLFGWRWIVNDGRISNDESFIPATHGFVKSFNLF